jgi:peptidoglycan/xylan/chitin deacetylase (PgdA/CDA1 family)
MRSKMTVLMYHRVLEDAECIDYPFPSLVIPRSLFEAQVDWLAERMEVLPVSDALARMHDPSGRSKPVVCLTFDDGYVDNFELVAPVLEARGLRGTFFITAGAVQTRAQLWYDRAAAIWAALGREEVRRLVVEGGDGDFPDFSTREAWIEWLKSLSDHRRTSLVSTLANGAAEGDAPCLLMTPEQVRQLAERGHEVGSHTLSHPILPSMEAEQRRAEIEVARRLLQEWTKQDVAGFCYPNGDFDADVIRALEDAGHRYACTTRPGRNGGATDPFQLRRIDITPDRIAAPDGRFDSLGFRAELSLFREGLRRTAQLGRKHGR